MAGWRALVWAIGLGVGCGLWACSPQSVRSGRGGGPPSTPPDAEVAARADAATGPAPMRSTRDAGRGPNAGDASSGGSGAVDAGCSQTTPVPTQVVGDPPDMLLTVDISASMCAPLGLLPVGGSTKMRVMKDALRSLVRSKDERIHFGLLLFPEDNGCAPGRIDEPTRRRNAGEVIRRLDRLSDDVLTCGIRHGGGTPTHTSLGEARRFYASAPRNPAGRYVLLATDGIPNCGEEVPDAGTAETVEETVAAVAALRAEGIRTFVLGFGSLLAGRRDTLQRLAEAGETGRFYLATSATELDRALNDIAAEVIVPSCDVALDGPRRAPELLRVRFDDGPPIPRNPARTSGWDVDPASPKTLTFHGAECRRLERGHIGAVHVDFGCPGPLI